MSYIVVDIESDGPIPGDYSMICFGAVIVDSSLDKTFYGELKPISNEWVPEALAVSEFTREETLLFKDPLIVMQDFEKWIKANSLGRHFFISDNNGFDWMFMHWYFQHFLKSDPFGWSSTNLGSLYKGITRNMFSNFKYLRETEHTHNPVDDAKGNAEAFKHMISKYNLGVKL